MESSVQNIIVEGLGDVKIKRRRGQKSTTLRLSKSGELIVSTNYSTPLYSIKHFVESQQEWVNEVRLKSGLFDDIEIFDGQIISKDLKLEFRESSEDNLLKDTPYFSYRKGENLIKVFIGSGKEEDVESIKLNNSKRAELEVFVVKALRERAKRVLPNRLKEVASVMSANYGSVTIRNTSSRWGSCSSRNDINLSLWLMILPQDLVDYVLIHELAHAKFKNHKKEFWDEVSLWEPDYKILRKKLKKYSAQVWW
jgi:predicted metal-dependent hydrolase